MFQPSVVTLPTCNSSVVDTIGNHSFMCGNTNEKIWRQNAIGNLLCQTWRSGIFALFFEHSSLMSDLQQKPSKNNKFVEKISRNWCHCHELLSQPSRASNKVALQRNAAMKDFAKELMIQKLGFFLRPGAFAASRWSLYLLCISCGHFWWVVLMLLSELGWMSVCCSSRGPASSINVPMIIKWLSSDSRSIIDSSFPSGSFSKPPTKLCCTDYLIASPRFIISSPGFRSWARF